MIIVKTMETFEHAACMAVTRQRRRNSKATHKYNLGNLGVDVWTVAK
jgi:hypothetical protein